MGMVLTLARCDVETLGELRKARDVAVKPQNWLERIGISKATQRPEPFADYLASADEAESAAKFIDLDKSWHAIHFLLTGAAWDDTLPSGALLSGEAVSADLGYGPVRLLSVADVGNFADVLRSKPDDYVESAFNHEAPEAANIYPNIWDRRDPTNIEYVAENFRNLKSFVLDAAAAKEAIVLAIT